MSYREQTPEEAVRIVTGFGPDSEDPLEMVVAGILMTWEEGYSPDLSGLRDLVREAVCETAHQVLEAVAEAGPIPWERTPATDAAHLIRSKMPLGVLTAAQSDGGQLAARLLQTEVVEEGSARVWRGPVWAAPAALREMRRAAQARSAIAEG